MLRTKDGWRVNDMLEAFDTKVKMAEGDEYFNVEIGFTLDGSTSAYKGHEGEIVYVIVNTTVITLICGENQIKLPNMCRTTLPSMIERAAEILLFERGVIVE